MADPQKSAIVLLATTLNICMSEAVITVYQVRSIDHFGNQRIVHAYETEAAAKEAMRIMRNRTGSRYVSVPVPNQPNQYWGINFPEPVKKKK